jgi:hypothetical protein
MIVCQLLLLTSLFWLQEFVTDKVTGELPTLEDLGVTLTKLENQAPWELKPFRQNAYYEEYLGEFPPPPPPPPPPDDHTGGEV